LTIWTEKNKQAFDSIVTNPEVLRQAMVKSFEVLLSAFVLGCSRLFRAFQIENTGSQILHCAKRGNFG